VNPTIRKFILFGIAGGAGFVVDTAVLYLVKGTLGPYGGRVVSFFVAVVATWLINRSFAFKSQRVEHLPIWREFLHYLGAMILGGVVNFAVYAALVAAIPLFAEYLVLAVAGGVAAGMGVNFLLADRLVFRRKATTSL
jgi:putative flippase GtrA